LRRFYLSFSVSPLRSRSAPILFLLELISTHLLATLTLKAYGCRLELVSTSLVPQ